MKIFELNKEESILYSEVNTEIQDCNKNRIYFNNAIIISNNLMLSMNSDTLNLYYNIIDKNIIGLEFYEESYPNFFITFYVYLKDEIKNPLYFKFIKKYTLEEKI